ncbi:MAG TPA: ATP-binding protein [Longimicrobiales bacterium]|nr:ATP-binding protein [Longimicrobiales bacterium]
MKLSIRQKLYGSVFTAAILPLALLALWMTRGAERAGIQLLHEQLAASVKVTMRTAQERWFYRYGDLLLLANNQVVVDALESTAPPAEPPAYIATLFASLDRGVRRVRYYDKHGKLLWSFGSDLIPTGTGGSIDRAVFAATSVVPTRIQIRSSDNRVIGALDAEVHVNALISDTAVSGPAGGTLAVFDRRSRAMLTPTNLPADALRRRTFKADRTEWLIAHDSLESPPLAFAMAAPMGPFVSPFRRVARNGVFMLLFIGAGASLLTAWLTARVMRSTLDQLARAQSFAAVGQYAASLSHEVRNALTSIRVDLQRVESGESDQNRLVKRALRNIIRLDNIVNNSLRTARSGTIEPKPVDINLALKRAIQSSEHAFAERSRGVTFTPLPGAVINGNGDALQQLFLNLLLNAAEADGDAKVEVARGADNVCVTITDNGAGFQPGAIAQKNPPTSKPNGSGLGLAIARDIVKAHGGTIEFESAPSRTRVAVTIPLG